MGVRWRRLEYGLEVRLAGTLMREHSLRLGRARLAGGSVAVRDVAVLSVTSVLEAEA